MSVFNLKTGPAMLAPEIKNYFELLKLFFNLNQIDENIIADLMLL